MKQFILLFAIFYISAVAAQTDLKTDLQQRLNLINLGTDVYNGLIAEPINVLSSSLASLLVQLTAGVALEGLQGFGKRGFEYIDLSDYIKDILKESLASIALSNWSAIGKRDVNEQELRGLISSIVDILYPIVDQQVKETALTITQILANVAENGVLPIIG